MLRQRDAGFYILFLDYSYEITSSVSLVIMTLAIISNVEKAQSIIHRPDYQIEILH